MKVTVCELPDDRTDFSNIWASLCNHCHEQKSEFVLLPEMPFSAWLAATQNENDEEWNNSIQSHLEWICRLPELGVGVVAGSRPVLHDGERYNVGFIWTEEGELVDMHAKRYLPEEPGFWEATWYRCGTDEFRTVQTPKGKIGFLICTELWFNHHARNYGKKGVQLILCPRATEGRTVEKWVIGGRAASVVSGAYCLSSNRSWNTEAGKDNSAMGWIIEPVDGRVLGLTSSAQPYLTINIDLAEADYAKTTYPRDVIG